MKHFGIFILFVVTFIQYGYGEGEEATQGTEGETVPTNTEGESPTDTTVGKEEEQKVEESGTQGAGSEGAETQDNTVATEVPTVENAEQQTEAAVAESVTEHSATINLQGNPATVKTLTFYFPDWPTETIVSTNPPPSEGEKDNEPSPVTTKRPYTPGLCLRPLPLRWPSRPCPCPFSRFTSGDFQSPGQRPVMWAHQNIPTCANRPLPETPAAILLKLRALRNNNMNQPLCPYGDGGVNRMPMGYPGSRIPVNYLRQSYTHL